MATMLKTKNSYRIFTVPSTVHHSVMPQRQILAETFTDLYSLSYISSISACCHCSVIEYLAF